MKSLLELEPESKEGWTIPIIFAFQGLSNRKRERGRGRHYTDKCSIRLQKPKVSLLLLE
jgi:hypothetical protein